MHNDIKSTILTSEQIQDTCKRLGSEITKDYAGKKPAVYRYIKGINFIHGRSY